MSNDFKNMPLKTAGNIAVIFAGGHGERFGNSDIPKQFHELSGKPVIVYTLEHFERHDKIDGTVVDVAVENSLYGEIRATLNLCNRYDVDNFIRQAADAPESLLSRMTGGVHLHTLRCPDKDTFARIRDALEQQGLLYRKE